MVCGSRDGALTRCRRPRGGARLRPEVWLRRPHSVTALTHAPALQFLESLLLIEIWTAHVGTSRRSHHRTRQYRRNQTLCSSSKSPAAVFVELERRRRVDGTRTTSRPDDDSVTTAAARIDFADFTQREQRRRQSRVDALTRCGRPRRALQNRPLGHLREHRDRRAPISPTGFGVRLMRRRTRTTYPRRRLGSRELISPISRARARMAMAGMPSALTLWTAVRGGSASVSERYRARAGSRSASSCLA
jgi:hypothetical protein